MFMKNPNLPLKIGQIPPVMDPLLSGSIVFDTEREAGTFSLFVLFVFNNLFIEKFSHIEKQRLVVWLSAIFNEITEIWGIEDS